MPHEVSPAAQRLIALIAVRGSHTRGQAARTLFPGSRPTLASARLRDLLSRNARGPGSVSGLLAPGRLLALDAAVSVDVCRLDAPTTALGSGQVEALARLPWDVELLPGWSQTWVMEERERLHRTVSHALKRCCAICLRVGDVPGAVATAERAVSLDPLDEPAARWLIRAHLAAGDPAPALRRFQALRAALRDELGVDPEPATRQLLRCHLPATGQVSHAR